MKLLFVNPPNTTSLHVAKPGTYVEENIGRGFFILPRIPFEVMASFPEQEDVQKDILLLDFEWYKNPDLTQKQLIELIERKTPDFVLTTLIAQSNADSIDWLTTQIKEHLPSTKIILGGQGVSLWGEKTFTYCPSADFAYMGDSAGIPLLLQLFTDSSARNIPGLKVTKEGLVQHIASRETCPFSPQQLYGNYQSTLDEIVTEVHSRGAFPLGMLETYKGCPYPCEFCAAKKPTTFLNLENVLDELSYLYAKGIKKFYFIDLTFGLHGGRTQTLLKRLHSFKQEHADFGFRCVTRSDRIHQEFVHDLAQAGCYEAGVGVETFDNPLLGAMNKKANKESSLRAVRLLSDHGVWSKLFLIEGYPGSNAATSKATFDFLNILQKEGLRYFVQPALSRDILPSLPRFVEKEKQGILRRGTMSQLDFRHDCRAYGWDNDKDIRSMCSLMLAYPSTEISKRKADYELQARLMMDLPFLASSAHLPDAIQKLNTPDLKRNEIRGNIAHLLEGVYTREEVCSFLSRIHLQDATELEPEFDEVLAYLREQGFVDSFGNPNLNVRYLGTNVQRERGEFPHRPREMMLFSNGFGTRYIYLPPSTSVKPIKTSFYTDIPEDVFMFLHFARGILSLHDIANKLYLLFGGKEGFETRENTLLTFSEIYHACKHYGFLN